MLILTSVITWLVNHISVKSVNDSEEDEEEKHVFAKLWRRREGEDWFMTLARVVVNKCTNEKGEFDHNKSFVTTNGKFILCAIILHSGIFR